MPTAPWFRWQATGWGWCKPRQPAGAGRGQGPRRIRQLVLEASSGTVAPAPVVAPPTPKPVTPPVIQPIAPPAPPAAATSPTKSSPARRWTRSVQQLKLQSQQRLHPPSQLFQPQCRTANSQSPAQAKKGPSQSLRHRPRQLLISTAMPKPWPTSSTAKFCPLTTLGR